MDSLRNEPRAHQVLMMPGEGEVVPPEIEALRRSGREFLKNCLIPSKEIDVPVGRVWADEWGLHPQNHPDVRCLHVS